MSKITCTCISAIVSTGRWACHYSINNGPLHGYTSYWQLETM